MGLDDLSRLNTFNLRVLIEIDFLTRTQVSRSILKSLNSNKLFKSDWSRDLIMSSAVISVFHFHVRRSINIAFYNCRGR